MQTKHEVFISFKNSGKGGLPTEDSKHARLLYEALKAAGLKVFFSEESLAESGKGTFSRSIEMALESARVLILVASCREHVLSRWVEAEWDSFLQDLHTGNKDGEIFILACGSLKKAELPIFLRRQQWFAAESLAKLVEFVVHAIPLNRSLRNCIRASLHCFDPKKREDKVYVLTVHPGSSADTYHVTAHWGPREAKRLSSQIKAIDVTAEIARLEVERARKEKLHSGYVSTAFSKIVTPEARLHISAALGLPGAHKKAASIPQAGGKPRASSKQKEVAEPIKKAKSRKAAAGS